ncbi:MAG: thiamine pyrophosphate-binding protein [Armatimonadota bacterium]|nr:thiamine pyrophosphate-binding protein [Armatimonadota bacterium]MDW8155443.1 thiamine pyrophosphate-binding protein [Armatimonadota bacterium]
MTVAEFVARTLAREGVGFVAGVPGSGLMEILDTLDREGGVRLVQVRHEQVAALMAVGYGKAARRPAVCVGTRSPGGTNLVMGVTAAFIESVPLVCITGQVPTKYRWKGAFEEADLAEVFRPITKYSVEVQRADRVPDVLWEALRVAQTGRPGPVHVAIPYDLAKVEIRADVLDPEQYRPTSPPSPDPRALDRAAEVLRKARRPVLIAGGGVWMAGASEAALQLATLLEAPVVSTWQKKPVSETYPLAMGTMGYGGSAAAAFALRYADAVLAVGTRLWDRTTDEFSFRPATGARLVQVDVDPAAVGRNYPVDVAVVGDARLALEGLLERLRGQMQPDPEWARQCRLARAAWEERLRRRPSGGRPVRPWDVVRALRRVTDEATCLVTDSGSYIHYAAQYFTALRPGVYFNPNSGSMGFGLPGAMGVHLARPDSRVVALAGDGGFLMTVQDLETAVREKLPVVCVVLNNFAFGSINTRQKAYYAGREVWSRLQNPDFVQLAEAFGVWAVRVERGEELEEALRAALEAGRPALVEVRSEDLAEESPLLQRWWDSGQAESLLGEAVPA